jgi:hypothetical protein
MANNLQKPVRKQINEQKSMLTESFDTIWDQFGAVRVRPTNQNKQQEIEEMLKTLKDKERIINSDIYNLISTSGIQTNSAKS